MTFWDKYTLLLRHKYNAITSCLHRIQIATTIITNRKEDVAIWINNTYQFYSGYIEEPFHFPGIPPFTIANDKVKDRPESNHFSIVTSPFLVNNKIPLKSDKIQSFSFEDGEILKLIRSLPSPHRIASASVNFGRLRNYFFKKDGKAHVPFSL